MWALKKGAILISAVALIIIVALSFYFLKGYGKSEPVIRAGTLQGGISTLDEMEYFNLSAKQHVELRIFRFEKTTDILAAIDRGDIDVAVIPSEMAAKLLLDGVSVKIISPEMLQNQAILTRGGISSPAQLKGGKVVSLLSSGSYMMFKAYMKSIYNLSVVDGQQGSGDIIGINSPPGTILDALGRGDAAAAVVWEPFVSQGVVRYNFTILTTFQDLWKQSNSTGLPVMLVWVATENFTNDKDRLEAFLAMRSSAVELWRTNSSSIETMLSSVYGLSNIEASYLYGRVIMLDNGLNETVKNGIRSSWNLAWKGGYLSQDPSKIGDQAFFASS